MMKLMFTRRLNWFDCLVVLACASLVSTIGLWIYPMAVVLALISAIGERELAKGKTNG